jgi:hypothetical protein
VIDTADALHLPKANPGKWPLFYKSLYIYIPMSLTSAGSRSALLRFIGSVSNLSLLTIGGYYYYNSHDKMMERKIGDRIGIWYGYWRV